MQIGRYGGEVAEDWQSAAVLDQLGRLGQLLDAPGAEVLTAGRNRHVKVALDTRGGPCFVAVKAFGAARLARDLRARRRGSKARLTWLAATHLQRHGVGTPEPIAFLERWDGGRLAESYFVSRFAAGITNFRDELERLFHDDPVCERILALMQCVADAVRAMHAAGFQHNDLGNQNILLRRTGEAAWSDVAFVDLNRGRIRAGLTLRQRARDLSRIYLPSDLLRVFTEMYFGDVVPGAFQSWERWFRRSYGLHSCTRSLRHPRRSAAERRQDPGRRVYPAEKDLWIWDERSAQAISALRSRDRRRHYPPLRHLRIAAAAAAALPAVWRQYRALMPAAYGAPVDLAGRVGVGLNPRPAAWSRERVLLERLGRVPVLIRFYHHETMQDWTRLAAVARELAAAGHAVCAALVQDRRAVLEPGRWAAFVAHVLARLEGAAETVELGHAINRVKWGLWDYAEYGRLLQAVAAVAAMNPGVRFIGPAAIDFEYADALAALRRVPPALRFHALSHHLYVDRRGAPENRQGPFSALEKFALARAVARASGACEDRLIVSEVNWPLRGTGAYSPVTSPWESPGPRFNDPSVSEDDYADYMLRYLAMALCSGFVERVYWWRLVARGFGLVDDTDAGQWRERPAYGMLRRFLELAGSARFVGRTAEGGRVFLRFERPEGPGLWMAYAPEGPRPAALPFDAARAEDAFGRALPLAGLQLSGRPVYVWER